MADHRKYETLSRPNIQSYRELPAVSWADWRNVEMVRSAIRQLEAGQFDAAAQLVDAMGCDDRISGVLSVRANALPGLPMKFKPQGDGRQSKMVAREARKAWRVMFPDPSLVQMLKWGILLNCGLGELVWNNQGVNRWTPTLKVWHPRWVWWREDTESYWVNTAKGQVEVKPGNGQWVLFTPFGRQRAWMEGAVRRLYLPWLLRQWGQRDWARASEVYGAPIKKAVTPVGASDESKERFIREITNMGSEITISTPRVNDETRYDIELLEAENDFSGSFEKLIQMANVSIAVTLLGQNLTTEVEGGAYAAAKVHNSIRYDILRTDAQATSEAMREQGLVWWSQHNWGSKDIAPELGWITEPPEDLKTKGDGLKSVGDGLTALQMAGAQPDVDKILAESGIPIKGPAQGVDDPDDEGDDVDPRGDQDDDSDPTPGQDVRPTQKRARASMTELTARIKATRGAIAGQLYVDDVVDEATQDGREALAVDLGKVIAIVERASDFESLRTELVAAYGKMSPAKFADLMSKALVMAELAGRHAVLEDAR